MTAFNQSIANQDALARAHLSENHFGFSPAVWPCVLGEQGRMNLYPDPESRAVREAIASFYDVDADMVAVANGMDEIILMTALAFLGEGVPAVTSSATFPGYLNSASVGRAEIRTAPLDGYRVPTSAMGALCRERRSVAFVCNPHNPTGTLADADGIADLVRAAAETGSLPVFDEAYAEFAGPAFASAIPLVRGGERALVTRTFSKAYGLAGFRIGYAIGRPEDIARVRALQSALPFAVNRLAQAAAICALRDQAFLASVVTRTQEAKAHFCSEMGRLGIEYVPSHTNFVALRIEESRLMAARLHGDFGILVRETTPFGLPSHVRVSMASGAPLNTLIASIATVHRGLLSPPSLEDAS